MDLLPDFDPSLHWLVKHICYYIFKTTYFQPDEEWVLEISSILNIAWESNQEKTAKQEWVIVMKRNRSFRAHYFSRACAALDSGSLLLASSAVLRLAFTRWDSIESRRCVTWAPTSGARDQNGEVLDKCNSSLHESTTVSTTRLTWKPLLIQPSRLMTME